MASHYDNQAVALMLLDKQASPHATAKNGHTPLHIAAKKNQVNIVRVYISCTAGVFFSFQYYITFGECFVGVENVKGESHRRFVATCRSANNRVTYRYKTASVTLTEVT